MLKAEISSKTVTPAQIKFLHLLHERGPLTANELAGDMGKSVQYAHQIIRELRERGIIEKTYEGIDMTERHLSWKYKLSIPIDEIDVRARLSPPHKIPEEEVLYVAILRNAPPECGMTGQNLVNQFKTVFPHRAEGSLRSRIIPRARREGWCR